MAERLRLSVGDIHYAAQSEADEHPFRHNAQKRYIHCRVGFQCRRIEYEQRLILMPLSGTGFFQTGDGVTELDVDIADPDGVLAAHQAIASAVGPDYRVIDWQQANLCS